ncbi:hypothetical protein HYFRA_00007582 [Hymenoscyphus fraxineus]|uniref:Uncharacterized protein n=1 Tax=Hymenoscyphus fraxineus TaxID=746836 RepID=A0A9N9PRY4_9HELO|nr:hypothetical protein HYFRA_00007582 [Hymenoscyphus fraxineus]
MTHEGPRDATSWTDVHFALFVLVDISTDQINQILQTSYSGASLGSWNLWLATSYTNAPRKQGDQYTDGTKPPVPKDWNSPFLGKSIPDAVEFMEGLPDESTVDWHHFVIVGEDYLKSGIVNLCRIGDEELKGKEVDVLPCSVEHASLTLMGLEPHGWEEIRSNVEDGFSPI